MIASPYCISALSFSSFFYMLRLSPFFSFFFFNDTATTEIYTLSLHDALPIFARFFFGMGEAGCFPNLTKAFMIWLPYHERTRAQSVLWLSARWGGAFTPLLVIWVMSWLSWRNTFALFGSIGVVWAFVFYRSFRDRNSR